jgi:hypothetical protein
LRSCVKVAWRGSCDWCDRHHPSLLGSLAPQRPTAVFDCKVLLDTPSSFVFLVLQQHTQNTHLAAPLSMFRFVANQSSPHALVVSSSPTVPPLLPRCSLRRSRACQQHRHQLWPPRSSVGCVGPSWVGQLHVRTHTTVTSQHTVTGSVGLAELIALASSSHQSTQAGSTHPLATPAWGAHSV